MSCLQERCSPHSLPLAWEGGRGAWRILSQTGRPCQPQSPGCQHGSGEVRQLAARAPSAAAASSVASLFAAI